MSSAGAGRPAPGRTDGGGQALVEEGRKLLAASDDLVDIVRRAAGSVGRRWACRPASASACRAAREALGGARPAWT